MEVSELLHLTDIAKTVAEASKGASAICFSDGKMQYLGASLYLSADAPSMPSCTLSLTSVGVLHKWLLPFERWEDFKLTVKSGYLTLTRADQTLRLHIDNADAYVGASEIVTRSLLVNDFEFTAEQNLWEDWVASFAALKQEKQFNLINVATDTEGVTLGMANILGMSKRVLPVGGKSPSDGWNNFYDLSSLSIKMPRREEDLVPKTIVEAITTPPKFDIKFSYAENTTKLLSPLLLCYNNDIKLVLSPAWK